MKIFGMFNDNEKKQSEPPKEEVKSETREIPKPKPMENIDLFEEALKRKGIEYGKPARVTLPQGGLASVIVIKTDTGFSLYSSYTVPLSMTDLAFDEKCKTVSGKK